MSETLGDLGEREIIRRLLHPRYGSTTFGDDCAVLPAPPVPDATLVASTDLGPAPLLVAGSAAYYDRGWLLATANLSDLAAAAATPLGILASYVLPSATRIPDFEALLDGIDDCCTAHGTAVVGGNLSDGDTIALSATALGFCLPGQRLGRRGSAPTDCLVLIGSPGLLWTAILWQRDVLDLPAELATDLLTRARRPQVPLALIRELSAGGYISSAIDVSDGLYGAISELCEANSVGALVDPVGELDAAVSRAIAGSSVDPFQLFCTWGDWSQLVVTSAEKMPAVISIATRHGYPASPVGVLTADLELVIRRDRTTSSWVQHAQERFTGESWSRSLMSTYLERLQRRV
jgi:thiamine-monophosphate kinase